MSFEFTVKLISTLIATVPAINAKKVGIIKLLFIPSELCKRVINQAPKIVGIPKSSEKKIASVFLIFKSIAVINVIPDLDTPGNNAKP